jgi:hypothetical protein
MDAIIKSSPSKNFLLSGLAHFFQTGNMKKKKRRNSNSREEAALASGKQ